MQVLARLQKTNEDKNLLNGGGAHKGLLLLGISGTLKEQRPDDPSAPPFPKVRGLEVAIRRARPGPGEKREKC